MKRKKMLYALVLGLVAAMALSAQGGKEKSPLQEGGFDPTGKLVSQPTTIRVMLRDSVSQPLKNYAPAQQEIFKETGVKLDYEIIPSASYDEKKNILFSTNNWPDIAFIPSKKDLASYAQTGIFLPLTQYVNEKDMPNFFKLWNQYPDMHNYLVGGELYAFPVVQGDKGANGFGPVIRVDLLEKNNLPVPQTFDELLDTLEKLHTRYPDSIPYTGRKGTKQFLKTTSYMLGSGFGSDGIYYDFDKKRYIYGPASQEFKTVLSWLADAYRRGILDPDYATSTGEQLQSKMSNGRALFYLDNSAFGPMSYNKALRSVPGCEDAKLQIIPIPENRYGQRRAITYEKELAGSFYAINAQSKHIDTIIKLLDWMYSDRGRTITNYGVEGYSFTYNAEGKPEYKLDYLEKFRDAKPSSYYAVFSDLGVTKLNFTPYTINDTLIEIQKALGQWDGTSEEFWDIVYSDPAYHSPKVDPSFTEEETEQVTEIMMRVETMLEQVYDKFIMGQEPIAKWDEIIAKEEAMGVRELEKIYNDAEARNH